MSLWTGFHPGTHAATALAVESLEWWTRSLVIAHTLAFVKVELVVRRARCFAADTDVLVS